MKQSPLKTLLLCSLVLCACVQTEQETLDENTKPIPSKLEQFRQQSIDSVYNFCDLSHDSISIFPDLSDYTIHHLDLSYNQIEQINTDNLPKEIQRLNISHNQLRYILKLRNDKDSTLRQLKELDVSHNKLRGINIHMPVKWIGLKRIIASHNDLVHIRFFIKLDYLDLSNNPRLGNIVRFSTRLVDTLVHNNIANGKPIMDIY